MAKLDIVLDGPPGPARRARRGEPGHFLEIECEGASVEIGEWVELGEGLHALRIDDPRPLRATLERILAQPELAAEIARAALAD